MVPIAKSVAENLWKFCGISKISLAKDHQEKFCFTTQELGGNVLTIAAVPYSITESPFFPKKAVAVCLPQQDHGQGVAALLVLTPGFWAEFGPTGKETLSSHGVSDGFLFKN